MPGRKPSINDLNDVIEHVTATIVMSAREEEFYRRSGTATSQQDVKLLMLDIADDLARLCTNLEARREKLWLELSELKGTK